MRAIADLPGGYISKTLKINSAQDCQALCSKTKDCVAYVVSPVTRTCFLKNRKHRAMTFKTNVAKRGGIAGLIGCRKNKKYTVKKCSRKFESFALLFLFVLLLSLHFKFCSHIPG